MRSNVFNSSAKPLSMLTDNRNRAKRKMTDLDHRDQMSDRISGRPRPWRLFQILFFPDSFAIVASFAGCFVSILFPPIDE